MQQLIAKRLKRPKLFHSNSWMKRMRRPCLKDSPYLKDQAPSNNRNLNMVILASDIWLIPKESSKKKSPLMKSWTKLERFLKWRKSWKRMRKRDSLKSRKGKKKERERDNKNKTKRPERTKRANKNRSHWKKK